VNQLQRLCTVTLVPALCSTSVYPSRAPHGESEDAGVRASWHADNARHLDASIQDCSRVVLVQVARLFRGGPGAVQQNAQAMMMSKMMETMMKQQPGGANPFAGASPGPRSPCQPEMSQRHIPAVSLAASPLRASCAGPASVYCSMQQACSSAPQFVQPTLGMCCAGLPTASQITPTFRRRNAETDAEIDAFGRWAQAPARAATRSRASPCRPAPAAAPAGSPRQAASPRPAGSRLPAASPRPRRTTRPPRPARRPARRRRPPAAARPCSRRRSCHRRRSSNPPLNRGSSRPQHRRQLRRLPVLVASCLIIRSCLLLLSHHPSTVPTSTGGPTPAL